MNMAEEKRYWRAIVHDLENASSTVYELAKELREVLSGKEEEEL